MQVSSMQPLRGIRVLVTRPKGQAEALTRKLRSLGAETIELPTIEIQPVKDFAQLDGAISRLSEYGWVIFTSVHGVRFFLGRMQALSVPLGIFRKVAAIGPATASALEHAGRRANYVPGEFLSERIADGLGEVKGLRILLPRADIASKKLPAALRNRGALVDEVVAYRTLVPEGLTSENLKAVFKTGVELVTFTSPSTVRNMAQVLGPDQLPRLLGECRIACIGPVTLRAAKELGLSVGIVAATHTVDALVEEIVNEIGTV